MNLSEAITNVADDAKTNPNIATVSERITREINRVGSSIWNGFPWSFRWRNYRIVTDIDYTTGTISATNGSRTITGSGTVFLSTHKNWHISFPADASPSWYKVRSFTSSTQLELDVPYQGSTGSGKTFILRHFDYVLPTEPWDMGSIVVTSHGKPVNLLDSFSIEDVAPTPLYSGGPVAACIYSSDSAPTVYSTGTLSGTINTTTLTGSGTAWLDNIYPGDLVVIGSYKYRVQSVDSDTQITLYNQQQVTSTAGTSYTITRQFGRILRIAWPSTTVNVLDIRALRLWSNLVNPNDTNELLHRYPDQFVSKVSAMELKSKGDARASQLLTESEIAWARAKAEDESLTQRFNTKPIYSYRTGTHAGWGRIR